jgi:hypothetical protein
MSELVRVTLLTAVVLERSHGVPRYSYSFFENEKKRVVYLPSIKNISGKYLIGSASQPETTLRAQQQHHTNSDAAIPGSSSQTSRASTLPLPSASLAPPAKHLGQVPYLCPRPLWFLQPNISGKLFGGLQSRRWPSTYFVDVVAANHSMISTFCGRPNRGSRNPDSDQDKLSGSASPNHDSHLLRHRRQRLARRSPLWNQRTTSITSSVSPLHKNHRGSRAPSIPRIVSETERAKSTNPHRNIRTRDSARTVRTAKLVPLPAISIVSTITAVIHPVNRATPLCCDPSSSIPFVSILVKVDLGSSGRGTLVLQEQG